MTLLFDWLLSNALTASLLALLAFGVSKAWPRRPALAHACWLLVLVKLLTPPLYVFPFTLPAASVVQATPAPTSTTEPASTASLPPSVSTDPISVSDDNELWELLQLNELMLASEAGSDTVPSESVPPPPASATLPASVLPAVQPAAWWSGTVEFWTTWGSSILLGLQVLTVAGTVYLLLMTLARIIRFERLLRLAQPAPQGLRSMTEQIGAVLHLKQVPTVLIVPGKVGPLLWQRWNEPVIVLPEGLLENINSEELQTVLAHELTHYRRGDHLWRYLELAAVTFYWWLPSAWWASRRLRQAEEECCDAGVVASLPDGVASYATALVRSLTFVAEPNSYCPALSSGLGPVTLLKRRLKMLHTKVERRLGVRGWLLLMAVAALALPIGITWADDDTPPPTRGRRGDDVRRDEARSATTRARSDGGRDVLPPVPSSDDMPPAPRSPVAPLSAASSRVPMSAPPGMSPVPAQNNPFTGAPAMPGQPPSPVGWAGAPGQGGSTDDMRAAAEDAVRQAEVDLKIRRMKVRSAQAAVGVYTKEVARNNDLSKEGAVSNADLQLSKERLEQAKIDVELANLGVEQGELNVSQARRKLSNLSRPGQQPSVMPPRGGPTTPSGSGYAPHPGEGPFGGVASTGPGGPGGPPGGGRIPPAGSGGVASTTPAPGGSGGSRAGRSEDDMAKTMFDNMDREKRGKLAKDDFPAFMKDRFQEFDNNKDGFVSFDEFKSNRDKLSARRGAGGLGGGSVAGGPGGLSGGFGGGGGAAAGAGGPGGFGGGGLGAGPGGSGFGRGLGGGGGQLGGGASDAFFRNFDRQNTGKIRREDVPEWMRERFFEMVDANCDGTVDHDEFSANYGKLWETSRSGRGGLSTARGGAAGAGAGRGDGRSEGVGRSEGGRGDGRGEGPAATVNRGGGRDQRDDRIEQLEKELRDMRKALEDLRKREPGPTR